MHYAAGEHGRTPLNLSGTEADPNTVAALQAGLKRLAYVTQRPAVDPGPITGKLTEPTMFAIASSFDLLAPQLPMLPRAAVDVALLAGSTSTLAKTAIGQYVDVLTAAVNAVTAQLGQEPQLQSLSSLQGFFAPGWYGTPGGVLVLVGAGLLLWAALVR